MRRSIRGGTCTGADQCAAKVREWAKRGADVIKITSTGGVLSQQGRGLEGHFDPAEIRSITSTAHRLGLKVAAHAHGARGIEDAARAGVDSIDHGTFADGPALQAMKQSGSWMVPTLLALSGVRDRLGKNIYTPVVEAKARQALSSWGRALAAARRAGVKIAFGTDAGVFEHGRNAEEARTDGPPGRNDPARSAGVGDDAGPLSCSTSPPRPERSIPARPPT